MSIKPLDDESLMPWGKYEGRKMEDVPARYLKFMYVDGKVDPPVKAYIEEYLNFTDEV